MTFIGIAPRLLTASYAPSVGNSLFQAKIAVHDGERSFRAAAEHMARAQALGAKQRQIADAVGKTVGWVNRLLQWRKSEYKDETPFGPQSKASRERRALLVQ